MTNLEFIKKHLLTSDGKRRTHGYIITDGGGNFWDFGDHYPLIRHIGKIKGADVFAVNCRMGAQYSRTTGKHIRLAFHAISETKGAKAVTFDSQYDSYNVVHAATVEIVSVRKTIQKTAPRAFLKLGMLKGRFDLLQDTIRTITPSMITQY